MTSPDYYKDFPALLPKKKKGPTQRELIYLDNAATTQNPATVIETIAGYYRDCSANPYRGSYRESIRATKLYEASRSMIAGFIGADPEELIFTQNASGALNLVVYSYALEHLGPGDKIVLPLSEHHSNMVPWQFACRQTGAELVFLIPNETGQITDTEIERCITSETRIVTLAYMSNVLGSVFPIEKVIERAKNVGATVVLDCAQSIAHRRIKARESKADFIAFSGHKMYGPMGVGVLYGRKELLSHMKPLFYGGEMIDTVFERTATYEKPPKRFEAGTPNVAGALGLAAAIDYLESVGFDTIERTEQALIRRLVSGLKTINHAHIVGNDDVQGNRSNIVSFVVEGTHPQDVALMLDDRGITIRAGTHCTQPLHRHLGLDASCRVSPCFYNTEEEIDLFLEAVMAVRTTISRTIMSMFP